MFVESKDELFCKSGLELAFFSQADIDKALEQQNIDRSIGVSKPIGAYLFEAQVITKEQIAHILKHQNECFNSVSAVDPAQQKPYYRLNKNLLLYFILALLATIVLGLGSYFSPSFYRNSTELKKQESSIFTASPPQDKTVLPTVDEVNVHLHSKSVVNLDVGKNVISDQSVICGFVNIGSFYAAFLELIKSNHNEAVLLKKSLFDLFSRLHRQARLMRCLDNITALNKTVKAYNADNKIQMLNFDPSLLIGRYLPSSVVCPSNGTYHNIGPLNDMGTIHCSIHGHPQSYIFPENDDCQPLFAGIDDMVAKSLLFESNKIFNPTGGAWFSIRNDGSPLIIIEGAFRPKEIYEYLTTIFPLISKPAMFENNLVMWDWAYSETNEPYQLIFKPTTIEFVPKKKPSFNSVSWVDFLQKVQSPETFLLVDVDFKSVFKNLVKQSSFRIEQVPPLFVALTRAQFFWVLGKAQILAQLENSKLQNELKTFIIDEIEGFKTNLNNSLSLPYKSEEFKVLANKLEVSNQDSLIGIQAQTNEVNTTRLLIELTGQLDAYAANRLNSRDKDPTKVCFANQHLLLGAIEMYNMDNKTIVGTFSDVNELQRSLLLPGGYLKSPLIIPDSGCSYSSVGNLLENGYIVCSKHGNFDGHSTASVQIAPNAFKTGKIQAQDGLVLRDAPASSAKKIVLMPFDSDVTITNDSGPMEKIGDLTNNWYQVKFKSINGWKEGWAFGGFILVTDKLQ